MVQSLTASSARRSFARLRRKYKAGIYGKALLFLAAVAACLLVATWCFDVGEQLDFGRHLQSAGAACNKDKLKSWEKQGGVVLYFIGILYLFLGIAIVCDTFFEPSLQAISDALNLSEDVAGATFMAAGSSAPELFSSIVSLANPSAGEDLGVGTIVGSAVFNILMIIGATGLFAGQILHLDWKPLIRDAIFYLLSVISIILAFMDKEVHWYEGLGFMLGYGAYITFMVFNQQIFEWADGLVGAQRRVQPEDAPAAKVEGNRDVEGGIVTGNINSGAEDATKADADDEDDEDGFELWKLPESVLEWPMWLLSWPWYACLTISIPPCGEEKWEKWYPLSFTMCIGWIMLISWFMVEWTAKCGCILGVPDVVMGVTVLAAGTSVPDCLASIAVAKKGQGDMAIANAVGSNVFDILLGLGAPWAFILGIQGRVLEPNTNDLIPSVLILLGVLVVYMGAISLQGWQMNLGTAVFFMSAYVLYAIYNIVFVWILDIYGSSIA